MNITELRYLVAIKKWGSVSAAAKQLYAAQPNVSKALKNLEEEYGLRLGEMFDAIDPNPLGSASLAQVHRARLVTGEDVAEIVSLWTGIPVAGITSSESKQLLQMEEIWKNNKKNWMANGCRRVCSA